MDDEKTRRRFLVLLLAAATLLLAILIEPLASALLTAAVLTGVLWPVQVWLMRRLGQRRSLAAGIVVFGVVIVIVGPILGMSAFVVDQASKGVKFVSETVQSEGVAGLIEKLPRPIRGPAHELLDQIQERTGADVSKTVTEQVQAKGPGAAAAVGRAVAGTWGFVFNATM
ncbi:MAG TPA: hypothetical protein VJR89_05710, partial [Polyangiales bacterium]|nr:hypothetical protein [Polyangiales bacterium]